jgi:DNA-directed RNA polymerase subunit RPC12/RpoP
MPTARESVAPPSSERDPGKKDAGKKSLEKHPDINDPGKKHSSEQQKPLKNCPECGAIISVDRHGKPVRCRCGFMIDPALMFDIVAGVAVIAGITGAIALS